MFFSSRPVLAPEVALRQDAVARQRELLRSTGSAAAASTSWRACPAGPYIPSQPLLSGVNVEKR